MNPGLNYENAPNIIGGGYGAGLGGIGGGFGGIGLFGLNSFDPNFSALSCLSASMHSSSSKQYF